VRGANMLPFNAATDCIGAATETEAHTLPADQTPPELAFDVTTPREAAIQAARAYLTRPGMAPTITAAQLNTLLTDTDPSNDPLVVSVRSAEHYALGHVPGAINIPYKEIANEEQLRKLPKDRKIVVYCYTGHTAGIATGILGMLGYDVVNLKWGINSWTQNMDVVKTPQIQPGELYDYPTTAGPNP
jgi:rhodanese-related sulfurtransferase